MPTEHIAAWSRPIKHRPPHRRNPISDRCQANSIAAGVGVLLTDDVVDIDLDGAITVIADGRGVGFRIRGNRDDLASALEWLANRIRIRSEGAA